MHSRKPTSCPEKANHVCSCPDCPIENPPLKYKTLTEEMIKGRFAKEIIVFKPIRIPEADLKYLEELSPSFDTYLTRWISPMDSMPDLSELTKFLNRGRFLNEVKL
jgi:hypothetical protein